MNNTFKSIVEAGKLGKTSFASEQERLDEFAKQLFATVRVPQALPGRPGPKGDPGETGQDGDKYPPQLMEVEEHAVDLTVSDLYVLIGSGDAMDPDETRYAWDDVTTFMSTYERASYTLVWTDPDTGVDSNHFITYVEIIEATRQVKVHFDSAIGADATPYFASNWKVRVLKWYNEVV